MITDLTGFPNHHACPVIDEKVLPDGRTGMDINASFLMRPLGHHTWQEWHIQLDELVCNTIHGHGHHARVA